MTNNYRNRLASVVVLDINFAGYGILRSLASYGIPLIGLYSDPSLPEARTRLCKQKYHFSDDAELLQRLTTLPELAYEKPVLMLTSDAYVTFYTEHRERLDALFLVDMPNTERVNLLLNKDQFSIYAEEHDILIPQTIAITPETDLEAVTRDFPFPAILKPAEKDERWRRSNLKKAFHIEDGQELLAICKKAQPYSDNLILQQWVPGRDSNVYYCLGYFDSNGDAIATFTGYKLRQWPVGTGSTATTTIASAPWVEKETKRIFKQLHYRGFGSIEFKRHDSDGKYYLMEPTVGRLNLQEYAATLNGVNIPLAAYNHLTNNDIAQQPPEKQPVIYINEWSEYKSARTHIRQNIISFSEWRRSLAGHRAYRYWNKEDPSVFFGFIQRLISRALSNWKQRT